MKYVLVDKYDNIVTTIELGSNVGLSGAKTYFKGIKKMPEDSDFDKLWKVMSKQQYDTQFKSSLQNRQVEWWKEEPSGPDEDFDYWSVSLTYKILRYSYCILYSEIVALWDDKQLDYKVNTGEYND